MSCWRRRPRGSSTKCAASTASSTISAPSRRRRSNGNDRGGRESSMTYYSSGPSWTQRRWQPERLALYLFSVAGVRVSIQIFSIIMLAFELLRAGAIAKATQTSTASALGMVLAISGMLFLFVLLHEFGHCFGCRAVGGHADDVLMWPLGGLASCDPPDRPWEHLVTTLCGPAV